MLTVHAVHVVRVVLAVAVRVLAVLVHVVRVVLAVVVRALTVTVRVVVLVRVLAVAVRVLAVRAVRVLDVVVLVALMLAVAVLVVAVFVHAMTVLVVAMRVIVLVNQVRLLVPERRHKHLTKSMTQQVATNKHTPRLFLRFVTRNRPCALYQVKLDPLITARQRSLCASKLSKHASRSCIQKPNQMRWTGKLSVSQRHSLQIRTLVLLAS